MSHKTTVTLPSILVDKIITDYIVKNYGKTLGVKEAKELEWNDYSLIQPRESLNFTKR